jgi:hypothetical protein
MKKKISSGLFILFTGFSPQVFASAGYAKDGLEFILFLMGFLLLMAGFLEGMDYFNKNGKMLIHQFRAFIKKKVSHPPGAPFEFRSSY